jgi:RHS repeat-associated protein
MDHDPTSIDAVVALDQGVEKVHTLADALGSIHSLADAAARLRACYAYDVYGKRTSEFEEIATEWGFTGRRGGESGLVYSRARHYTPDLGSFVSVDPLGVLGGLHGPGSGIFFNHLYAYGLPIDPELGQPGPTNGRDPTGLFQIGIHRTITRFVLWLLRFREYYVSHVNYQHFIVDTLYQPYNHYHAMRDSGRPRAIAEARYFTHLSDQLSKAVHGIRGCPPSIESALEAIGTALHAAQDHAAHPDFPTWAEHYAGEPDLGDTDEDPPEAWILAAADNSLEWMKQLRRRLGSYWESVLFYQ